MTERTLRTIAQIMETFLDDPSLQNAQALEVALDPLADGDHPDAAYYDDLSSSLAQYRPEGGEGLYAREEMLRMVQRARDKLRASVQSEG